MTTALVIDSDRATCESLCQLLKLLDICAKPAYNAHAALLTLEDHTPDLIFLSCSDGVGEGEGVEFLEFLQGESALASIPVVLVVDNCQVSAQENFPRAGILEIVPRPAPLEAVERVLHKVGVV